MGETERPRILIADDEPVGRETLEALLFREEYELLFAASGMETLEVLKETPPDLVLLDVMMPEMDGYETCRRIRSDERTAEIPVIMVTALDDQESRIRGIEAGADDFVSKPFNRTELRARVRTVIRLNRYRRLVEERHKFQWAVERANDGYVILSDGVMSYTNPRALSLLGITDSAIPDIPFKTFMERVFDLKPAELWEEWPPESESDSDVHLYLIRPETETSPSIWLEVDTIPMSGNRILLQIRDISGAIRTQRDTWTFHAHAGHKLRTPLSILIGYLELAVGEEGLSPEDKDTYYKLAYEGAINLQEGVERIFTYLDAVKKPGGGECTPEEISMTALSLADELDSETKDITISSEVTDETGTIRLHIETVESMLRELCLNAVKFHPTGKPTIRISLVSENETLIIRVGDDGRTLTPEQRERMWHPYYQAERYFTGQTDGMGLGLSAIAAMVWSIGGTCRTVNDPDGPGIVAEIVLPLNKKEGG